MQVPQLTFEDFKPGETIRFGDAMVSRAALLEFATEFEPQALHLDENAAEETPLGGLAASGWHTCCLMMRMMCEGFLLNSTSLGAPGVEEVKWLKPVRPGDRLYMQRTVLEARESKSRPDVGLVKFLFEVLNAEDMVVMTMQNVVMFRKKSALSTYESSIDETNISF